MFRRQPCAQPQPPLTRHQDQEARLRRASLFMHDAPCRRRPFAGSSSAARWPAACRCAQETPAIPKQSSTTAKGKAADANKRTASEPLGRLHWSSSMAMMPDLTWSTISQMRRLSKYATCPPKRRKGGSELPVSQTRPPKPMRTRTHLDPGDALAGVLGLLLFEHQLDKELLQLFVAVVDAKLLKAV